MSAQKNSLLVFQAVILLIFSSCNSPENKPSTVFETIQDLRTIVVQVPDSLSNFEALLETSHLYYLHHMSPDYDNYGKEFWQDDSVTRETNWLLIRYRSGACEETDSFRMCIENQEHVINKRLNKVIKFKGNGSGYFATIDFIYNTDGLLKEYRNQHEIFYFKYNEYDKLIEINKSEINRGVQSNTLRIIFEPTTNIKSR